MIRCCVYTSKAVIPFDQAMVEKLEMKTMRRNHAASLSWDLYYHEGRFTQNLEGSA